VVPRGREREKGLLRQKQQNSVGILPKNGHAGLRTKIVYCTTLYLNFSCIFNFCIQMYHTLKYCFNFSDFHVMFYFVQD
jgi:hypothetical protein